MTLPSKTTISEIPFDLGALEVHKGCEDGPYFPKNNSKKAQKISNRHKFTAVIYTQLLSASPYSQVHLSAPIFKLARNIAASPLVDQVSIFAIISTQCGNFRIFLLLIFSVKSVAFSRGCNFLSFENVKIPMSILRKI